MALICGWVPLMHVVMIVWGRTIHLCWVSVVCRILCYLGFLVVVAWGESINIVRKPKKLYFKIGWGVHGGLYVGVVPRMHRMSGHSLAGHLHFGR